MSECKVMGFAKSAEIAKPESEDGGEVTITDELRKFKSHINAGLTPETVLALRAEVNCIADRIDAQFDRICEQNEAVLQHTIDTMVDERDELQEKCDRLKAKVEHQREQLAVYATMYDFDAIRALKRERNEHKHRADNAEGHVKSLERRLDAAHETYCALLNDAAREFRALTEERDELQASLRKIAERAGVPHDSEFDEYSDETVIEATLAQIDSTCGYVGALEWQRDRQKKMLDDYDQTHAELPKDANGEYIHIGDRVEDNERVVRIVLTNGSWEPSVYIEKAPCLLEEHFCCEVSHCHEPTVEQVIRDLTLGKITEAQAIERIEGINGQC
jgi:chromosome segregation ATPase